MTYILIAIIVVSFAIAAIAVHRAPQGCETDEYAFRQCNDCDRRDCPSVRKQAAMDERQKA